MRRVLVVILLLTACGPSGADILRDDPEFITVTDDLTGRTFRCLYVDGEYASDMLCYDLETGREMP